MSHFWFGIKDNMHSGNLFRYPPGAMLFRFLVATQQLSKEAQTDVSKTTEQDVRTSTTKATPTNAQGMMAKIWDWGKSQEHQFMVLGFVWGNVLGLLTEVWAIYIPVHIFILYGWVLIYCVGPVLVSVYYLKL